MLTRYLTCYSIVLFLNWGGTNDVTAQDEQAIATPDQQPATPPLQRGGILGRGRMSNRAQGMMPLLQFDSIRRELQVEGEQATKLESFTLQVREDFAEEIRQTLRSIRESNPEDRRQFGDRVGEIAQRINERLETVLNREQADRLKQINLQLGLRRNGAAEALTTADIATALDLTPEQIRNLRKQARENPNREPQTLAAARQEVNDVLTPAQQEKLENLLGPEFDLPAALLEEEPARGQGGLRRAEGRERRASRRALESQEPKEEAPEPPEV